MAEMANWPTPGQGRMDQCDESQFQVFHLTEVETRELAASVPPVPLAIEVAVIRAHLVQARRDGTPRALDTCCGDVEALLGEVDRLAAECGRRFADFATISGDLEEVTAELARTRAELERAREQMISEGEHAVRLTNELARTRRALRQERADMHRMVTAARATLAAEARGDERPAAWVRAELARRGLADLTPGVAPAAVVAEPAPAAALFGAETDR